MASGWACGWLGLGGGIRRLDSQSGYFIDWVNPPGRVERTKSGKRRAGWFFAGIKRGDGRELLAAYRGLAHAKRACERHSANPLAFTRTRNLDATWNEATGNSGGQLQTPAVAASAIQSGPPIKPARSKPRNPQPLGTVAQHAATMDGTACTVAIDGRQYRIARVRRIDGLTIPAPLQSRLFRACVKGPAGDNWQLISIHGTAVAAGHALDRYAAEQAAKQCEERANLPRYQVTEKTKGRRTIYQAWRNDRDGKPAELIGSYFLETFARKACKRHRDLATSKFYPRPARQRRND